MEVELFKKLREDIKAVKVSDPAATSSIAIFLCYPTGERKKQKRFNLFFPPHSRGLLPLCLQPHSFLPEGGCLYRERLIENG